MIEDTSSFMVPFIHVCMLVFRRVYYTRWAPTSDKWSCNSYRWPWERMSCFLLARPARPAGRVFRRPRSIVLLQVRSLTVEWQVIYGPW